MDVLKNLSLFMGCFFVLASWPTFAVGFVRIKRGLMHPYFSNNTLILIAVGLFVVGNLFVIWPSGFRSTWIVFFILFGNIFVGMGEYFILKRGNILEMLVIAFRPGLAELFSKQAFTGLAMVLFGLFLLVAPSMSLPGFMRFDRHVPESAVEASSAGWRGGGGPGMSYEFSDAMSRRMGFMTFGQFVIATLVFAVLVVLKNFHMKSMDVIGRKLGLAIVVSILLLLIVYLFGPSIFSHW